MKTRLQSLDVTTGFLECTHISFGSRLTCIIGARGTCKSTIVETLRFVFDHDPRRVQLMLQPSAAGGEPVVAPLQGIIRTTLEGGTARAEVAEEDAGRQNSVTIERSIDGPPRIFRDGVKEIIDNRAVLNRIEIYSQGDLQRIAEDGLKRLDLVDQPNRDTVGRLKGDREKAAKRLREIGPRLRQVRSDMDASRRELKQLESYRAELQAVQKSRPPLSEDLDQERRGFQQRQVLLERIRRLLVRRVELLNILRPLASDAATFREVAGSLAQLQVAGGDSIANIFSGFATALEQIEAVTADQTSLGMETDVEGLAGSLDALNQRYFALMKEQQEMTESLKREDGLRRQIEHLEALETQAHDFELQRDDLILDRETGRRRIRECNDELYSLRLSQVEAINGRHGNVVLLTLHQAARSQEYQLLIERLLQGSRIRGQDEVARDLAEKVLPNDLVDIVEAGDSKRLAEMLGRDLGQMARVVAYLLDSPALYELEGVVFDDWLEITMYVDDVPKPVSQLSKGQMATALLPLILRNADYPLIFDQPEDDLDNAFIYETLVKKIHALKSDRQLIFITHNANIPVLGDAERVVVMSMKTPRRASEPIQGDVDATKALILDLLEGGAEAFELRRKRYGGLIK